MDLSAPCPRCGIDLDEGADRRTCARCGGVWIGEPELRVAIAEALEEDVQPLAFEPGDPRVAPRACPRCAKPMQPCGVQGIDLDRCESHGVWFDTEEFRITLERLERAAKEARPIAERALRRAKKIGHWLLRTSEWPLRR